MEGCLSGRRNRRQSGVRSQAEQQGQVPRYAKEMARCTMVVGLSRFILIHSLLGSVLAKFVGQSAGGAAADVG